MKAVELINEFYDPGKDMYMIKKTSDTHRPRLTLKHLNELRKSREIKKAEDSMHADFVPVMYTPPAQTEM